MNKRQRKKRRWLYVPKKMRKNFIDDANLYFRVGDFDTYGPMITIATASIVARMVADPDDDGMRREEA